MSTVGRQDGVVDEACVIAGQETGSVRNKSMSDTSKPMSVGEAEPLVLVEREHVDDYGRTAGIIRFNRPDQMNAMNWDVVRALGAALLEFESDKSVRTVLITGSGPAFSAGGDIRAYKTLQAEAESFTRFVDEYMELTNGIADMTKPVVALVNGICVAGGLELLLSCDFAWAAESARIGDMHINFAQVSGAGCMARLPRLIGQSRAMELMLYSRMLSAQEAKEWGLVNRVIPDEELFSAGIEFARSVAASSPNAQLIVKQTIRRGMNTDLAAAIQLERDECLRYATTLPDSMEGINAFLEKRAPVFK